LIHRFSLEVKSNPVNYSQQESLCPQDGQYASRLPGISPIGALQTGQG